MRGSIGWIVLILLPALAAIGCPGDGSLLDDITGPGGPEPTLAWIQANVFTPVCTECHVPGGSGPMPLDNEDASFQNLVSVPSLELPMMMRVAPGDAENSYLFWKVEGRLQILGSRMPPPPRPMLELEQIGAIVEWIDMGAQR